MASDGLLEKSLRSGRKFGERAAQAFVVKRLPAEPDGIENSRPEGAR